MTISGVPEWAASFFSVCPDDETLAAYLDGRLLRIERSGVVVHLAGCGTCVELLATLAPDLTPYLAPRGWSVPWLGQAPTHAR